MKSPLDKLALTMSVNFLRMMADIEQPENCKAFLPMHLNVYNRNKVTGNRIVEGWFYLNCKDSLKMEN